MMSNAYLLLGSNMGNPKQMLSEASRLLVNKGIKLLQKSSIYQTEPWGEYDQPEFFNQVLEVSCHLVAFHLLDCCKQIESELGRRQRRLWQQREIDIDILLMGDKMINEDQLTIPHAQLIKRKFALVPMCEIAPSAVHPLYRLTMQDLLLLCIDTCEVKKV